MSDDNLDMFEEGRKDQHPRTHYMRAWRVANPEKNAAYQRKWSAANLAREAFKRSRRRAAQLSAMPLWWDQARVKAVYAQAAERGWDVDHVVPLQSVFVCGLHTWHNLQVLAPDINRSKGNRCWPDMPDPLGRMRDE